MTASAILERSPELGLFNALNAAYASSTSQSESLAEAHSFVMAAIKDSVPLKSVYPIHEYQRKYPVKKCIEMLREIGL